MSIIIRQGTADDLPAVLQLIKELAAYENAPNEVTLTLEDMHKDGFGEKPLFELLVAESNGSIQGMALYFYSYSTWKGKCIYLEDIVVKEDARRKGIGLKLFEALIEKAHDFGAQRLQWQVLDWNQPAISFYKKINSNLDPSWINCKLTFDQLVSYTSSESRD
ncbi:MAG TPA: GNAT family N-acetyltransferase [Bacteroidales bacterium]|nr:MAG: GNAT family N-acetyltransferase [Bacteroidetes bacterium GWE2_42_24]OFY25919.1 MAG: GNAT family N-acetyltransferase [Bacteroidetes bacterium GWF2_43_11]HBZ66676.1 GNAT family N-acetyltransferase [Bacteroidales bacterium]